MADAENSIPGKSATVEFAWGTGKRKCAIARVRITKGSGSLLINDKPFDKYFTRQAQISRAMLPLKVADRLTRYDLYITVNGGGIAGQSDAVRLGVARALEKVEPNLRHVLKDAGCLTRDSRIKESKKYGQKGARKKFQFSKR